MENLETIKVANQEGKELELKVITTLKKPNDNKIFLIYTFDEKAENVDIYASIIKEVNGNYILDSITEKEDWDLVQSAIQDLAE